jgi:hypothetical protein
MIRAGSLIFFDYQQPCGGGQFGDLDDLWRVYMRSAPSLPTSLAWNSFGSIPQHNIIWYISAGRVQDMAAWHMPHANNVMHDR